MRIFNVGCAEVVEIFETQSTRRTQSMSRRKPKSGASGTRIPDQVRDAKALCATLRPLRLKGITCFARFLQRGPRKNMREAHYKLNRHGRHERNGYGEYRRVRGARGGFSFSPAGAAYSFLPLFAFKIGGTA